VEFQVRRGAIGDVERLHPLWASLHAHHSSLPGMPEVRTVAASWEHRRGQYVDWLGKDEYTLLIAERDGEPIGYAMVSIGEGAATWDLGERTAELETLAVLEDARGAGVGAALIDAALEVAAAAGAPTMAVGVAHSNADAIRFYEREGFERFYALMIRRSPPTS
jgi:ribosomal protein S18 acetylase RimI-like enzyme